jgi:hypothetical protein
VGQSPAGKNVSKEAEDMVEIRHQATTGEDVANGEDFMCAVIIVIFGVCNSERMSQLFAVKCSINPITNPNPVYSHFKIVKISLLQTIISIRTFKF